MPRGSSRALQMLKWSGHNVQCALRNWVSDSTATTGAALAFFCAFSLAPLLIILVTISGWFVGVAAAYGGVRGQLVSLFGPSTARILLEAAQNSQKGTGLAATTVSIASLLIGSTSVLAALQAALEHIWKSDALLKAGVLGWLRTRFLSLGFILALGFLLLVSLTVSTGLANLRSRVVQNHSAVVGALGVLDLAISIGLVSMLFALMYRYLPARRLPWKVVFIGGVFTALMFDAGRWGIGLYLAHSTEPTAFGAAASFAALLLWLYYTAQIFLLGAEFTACLGGLREDSTPARKTRGKRHR